MCLGDLCNGREAMLHLALGNKESYADWLEFLRDMVRRSLPTPVLVTTDGSPEGNKQWLKYRRSFDETRFFRYHCIAEEKGKEIGYGCLEQQSDDPAWLRTFVVCHPEKLSGEVGARLFDHFLEKAKVTPATNLWAREYQRDRAAEKFFREHGFVEASRFELPDELPMVVYTLKIG